MKKNSLQNILNILTLMISIFILFVFFFICLFGLKWTYAQMENRVPKFNTENRMLLKSQNDARRNNWNGNLLSLGKMQIFLLFVTLTEIFRYNLEKLTWINCFNFRLCLCLALLEIFQYGEIRIQAWF